MGGIGRLFCKDCGVMMLNAFFMRPNTEINPTSAAIEMYGLFTGTFTEEMSAFIESWQPQFHICALRRLFRSRFLMMELINGKHGREEKMDRLGNRRVNCAKI